MARTLNRGRRSSSSTGRTPNRNYSTNLASGGSVSVRDGVKTFSDNKLQVRGNNDISISGQSYSRNKGGTGFSPVIPSDKVSPLPELKLPSATAPTAVPDADVTNASLAGFGTVIEGNKFVPDPTVSDRSNAVAEANLAGRQGLAEYINSIRPKEGQNENALLAARKQSGFGDAQKEVNRYQNQINVITGKRDAQMLGLEDQGRGITETIIGGQQARISREAAIMAMPLQAQLAAAQGNLEVAATLMGQLFTAKSADIAAGAQFRQSVGAALLNYSNTSQANLLNAKMADIADKAAKEQADLVFLRQNVDSAIKSGATAAEVGNLASDSLTAAQKVALAQSITARGVGEMRSLDIQAQRANIAQSQAATSASNRANRPSAVTRQTEMYEGKLIDSQTGEVIKDLSGGAPVLDATTKRQVGEQLKAGENLLGLVTQYRGLIKTKGFESTAYGSQDTVGKYNALRGQITASYKDAKKLGTLDAGLLTLVDSIIGESPTSGAFTPLRNFFGGASNRVVSQLDSLIASTEKENEQARAQLGQYNTEVINIDESNYIDSFLGNPVNQTATFTPVSNYFR